MGPLQHPFILVHMWTPLSPRELFKLMHLISTNVKDLHFHIVLGKSYLHPRIFMKCLQIFTELLCETQKSSSST